MDTDKKAGIEAIYEFIKSIPNFKYCGSQTGFDEKTGILTVHNCFNHQLSNDLLYAGPALKGLRIIGNQTEEDSYAIISQLEHLETLELDAVGTGIPSNLNLSSAEKLKRVKISHSANDFLPKWIEMLSKLEELDISNTRIRELKCGLWSKGLIKLNINATSISELPEGIISIQNLNASNSNISFIPESYFKSNELRYLNISNTNIRMEEFPNTESIRVFLCRENPSTSLPKWNWKNIVALDLCGCNKLSRITASIAGTQLLYLNLCRCNLRELPKKIVYHFKDGFKEASKYLSEDEIEKLLKGEKERDRTAYIDGLKLTQMDLRYLTNWDRKFWDYYYERHDQKMPARNARIIVISDNDAHNDKVIKLLAGTSQLFFKPFGSMEQLAIPAYSFEQYLNRNNKRNRRHKQKNGDARLCSVRVWKYLFDEQLGRQFPERSVFSNGDLFLIPLSVRNSEQAVLIHKRVERIISMLSQNLQDATIGVLLLDAGEEKIVPYIDYKQLQMTTRLTVLQKSCCLELDWHNNWHISQLSDKRLFGYVFEALESCLSFEALVFTEWNTASRMVQDLLALHNRISEGQINQLFPNYDHTPDTKDNLSSTLKQRFLTWMEENKWLLQTKGDHDSKTQIFNPEWILNGTRELLNLINAPSFPAAFTSRNISEELLCTTNVSPDFFPTNAEIDFILDYMHSEGLLLQVSHERGNEELVSYCVPLSSKPLHFGAKRKKERRYAKLVNSVIEKPAQTVRVRFGVLTAAMLSGLFCSILEDLANYEGPALSYYASSNMIIVQFPANMADAVLLIQAYPGFDGELLLYCADVRDAKNNNDKMPLYHYIITEILSVPLRALKRSPIFANASYTIEGEHTQNNITAFVAYEDLKRYNASGYTNTYIPKFDTNVDTLELMRTFRVESYEAFCKEGIKHRNDREHAQKGAPT